MPPASSIFVFALIAIALLPLLFVGILFVLVGFNLNIPIKLIDAAETATLLTWCVGAILNCSVGLALIAAAVWLPLHNPTSVHLLLAPLGVLLGSWRIWRGVSAFPRKG